MQPTVIRTVLGDIAPADLGHTMTHEHLLIDITWGPPRDMPSTQRKPYYAEMRLENLYELQRDHWNVHDRTMLDENVAISEMQLYRSAGGQAIVDVTSVGLGRDPEALARISEATGVHIVMGAGYYVSHFHPPEVARSGEQELAERIAADVTEGAHGTSVQAGVIGEIGMTVPVHPDELKVLRAAVRAHVMSGAPLLIHPGRDARAPFEHLREVEALGGDPERTIIGHVDRTLLDSKSRLELAASGCYLALDLFGRESSYHPMADVDMPNDAIRVDWIIELLEAGHLGQVLVSQDICYRTRLRDHGGEGYGHILESVVPVMKRKGMNDSEIDAILIDNPAQAFALPPS